MKDRWTASSTEYLDKVAGRHGLIGLYPLGIACVTAVERGVAVSEEAELFAVQREKLRAARLFTPHPDALDPVKSFPWASGVIASAFGIEPTRKVKSAAGKGRFAAFAGGGGTLYLRFRDALTAAAQELESSGIGRWELSIDGPKVLDRSVARAAGLGWLGKSANVLTKSHGSYALLGTIITEYEPDPSLVRPPIASKCGTCVSCIQACPTGALFKASCCDASRCLSLMTQSPVNVSEEDTGRMGEMIYGCDRCQEVCPVNQRLLGRDQKVTGTFDPQGADEVGSAVDLQRVAAATDDDLRAEYPDLYFPGKKIDLLRRNALIALENDRA